METVKLGSRGESVKKLQRALGIKADGIFGPGTEACVKAFQKQRGLTDDGVVGAKTWEALLGTASKPATAGAIGGPVEYYPISVHITKCAGRKPKYIVIHYTAGASSTGDSERGVRKVFLSRKASADFVVDDDSMLQVNPDCRNYFCWAVGDTMANGKKRTITNRDCISIEICSTLKKGVSGMYPNHDGWSISAEAEAQGAELTKILQKEFGIDDDHVIRHFDITGKLCPGVPGWNTGWLLDSKTGKSTGVRNTEDKWLAFKKRLCKM